MRFRLAVVVAAISGFIALSYEILWYRAYSFVSQGSPFAFAAMLGSYLLGIALGSLATRRFCSQREPDARHLRPLAAFVVLASVFGFLLVPALARWVVFYSWETGVAINEWSTSFPLVAVSAGMFGAILPLVCHFGIRPDDLAGSRLSIVYVGNIVGSTSGSLLTGFVLMSSFSLAEISTGLTVLGLLLALGLALASGLSIGGRVLATAASAAAVAGVLAVSAPVHDQLYERLQFRRDFTETMRFAHVEESRYGVITVTQDGRIFGGGAYDGAFSTSLVDDRNWIVRGYAVPAMHPAPKEVLMVGLSSGSWAQVVAHAPGVEKLTIVEINPDYEKIIARYEDVRSLLENDKVEIVIDDGRRWLARHPDRTFDFIVQNTTHHWRAHITNLLSVEYLELVRTRLKPGGIFYYNTTWSNAAMRTAVEVFPHALRVINFMAVSDSPIAFDGARWRRDLEAWRIDGRGVFDLARELDRKRLDDVVALASTFSDQQWSLERRDDLLARLTAMRVRVITDDNMVSEWKVEIDQ